MMNHTQLQSKLQDYLEQLLSDDERQELESHLSTCSECREELNALTRLVLELDAIPEREPPDDLTSMIMARVQEVPKAFGTSIWDTIRTWLPKLGYAYGIGLIMVSIIGYFTYIRIASTNFSPVKAFSQAVVFTSTVFSKFCELMVGLWIAGNSLVRYGLPTISACLLIETILILAGISFWYFRRHKAVYLLVIK